MQDVQEIEVTFRDHRNPKAVRSGVVNLTPYGAISVERNVRFGRIVVVTRSPSRSTLTLNPETRILEIGTLEVEVAPTDVEAMNQLLMEAVRRANEGASSRSDRSPLATWGELLEWVSYILGAVAIIGGVLLAVQTDNSFGGSDNPYVWFGIGIVLNGVFFAALGITVAKLAKAYAEDRTKKPDTASETSQQWPYS